jgi:hypothetical protein
MQWMRDDIEEVGGMTNNGSEVCGCQPQDELSRVVSCLGHTAGAKSIHDRQHLYDAACHTGKGKVGFVHNIQAYGGAQA